MNYTSVLNLSVFVYSAIFNMFCPVLGYHQGNHSYTTIQHWLCICHTQVSSGIIVLY